VANLVATVGLYVPVLKQVKHSFQVKVKAIKKSKVVNPRSETESSNATYLTEIEMDNLEPIKERKETLEIKANEVQYKRKETIRDTSDNIPKGDQDHSMDSPEENTVNKHPKYRSESVQRRVTMMFLVIIVAYVLSYIPPLVILILSYVIKNFNFIKLSEDQTIAWIYLARFVFLNDIVNPFIYGYFDTKFRDQLQGCLKKWKTCLISHCKD
jgi:hypothetical protein